MAEVNPKAALTSSGPHPKSQDSLLGLSATYRPLNVPCKVQDELGLDAPGPYAPPSSPSRLTESGNDLQNVDDPESLSRYLSEFSFGQLSSPAPHTPPDSPGLPVLLQILTSGGDTEIEEEKARAFNRGFEIVDEIWDQDTYMYKPSESKSEMGDKSVKYSFVVRRQLGKPDIEPKCYIGIKSGGLRDIVHWALENAGDAPPYREATPSVVRDDDLTVDLNVLLNFLPQLECRLALYIGFAPVSAAKREDIPGEHLKKLVEFLKPFREFDTLPMTHPELELSAVYRTPNVSQNVQYSGPEGEHGARTPSHSPDLPAEGGNDLQNVVDPEFPFGRLNGFPFYPKAVSSSPGLRIPPGSASLLERDAENEDEARASKRGLI